MKPGEYIGTDGRTYTVTSVALRHNEGTPIVTVNLDGSSAILCAPHLRPGHPDFPAAVEALRSLVPKPEIHPCAGRAMAMREEEPFEWEWNGNVYTYNGQDVAVQSQLGDYEAITSPNVTATFNAGRRYQLERGGE